MLLVAGEGGRLELAGAVGLDDDAPVIPAEGGLAAEALAAGALRLAPDPGPPFPPGTRLGAAVPLALGDTRGALLVGTRDGPLDDGALLLLRVAADRAALLVERERLVALARDAADRARRVEEDAERRRHAVDTILGIVGHDLRNPLGAVHMSAALLQKRGGLAGWQARTVERMRSSAGRMGRIIADLLSYTRTRLGNGIPIQRSGADLRVVVGRVVDELRAANPDREISVDAREGEELSGPWDPDRLEQVASNLVSNAVDHGDPGTPVRVELAAGDGEVTLTVRNADPGLPPEVLEHLFEPFSRPPDERSRKASGLGLGLYICREIVRGHGGDISARTSDGEMAVSVRLPGPLRPPDPRSPHPRSGRGAPALGEIRREPRRDRLRLGAREVGARRREHRADVGRGLGRRVEHEARDLEQVVARAERRAHGRPEGEAPGSELPGEGEREVREERPERRAVQSGAERREDAEDDLAGVDLRPEPRLHAIEEVRAAPHRDPLGAPVELGGAHDPGERRAHPALHAIAVAHRREGRPAAVPGEGRRSRGAGEPGAAGGGCPGATPARLTFQRQGIRTELWAPVGSRWRCTRSPCSRSRARGIHPLTSRRA